MVLSRYYKSITMKTTVVQTKNVDIKIKEAADKRAREEYGLTSVQDIIRIFLRDFASGDINLNTSWGVGNDPEIKKAMEDYYSGKGKTLSAPTAKEIDDIFNPL